MTEEKAPLTEHDRGLRRRNWLMLYLPMLVGALLAVALVIVIGILGFRQGNVGGDPASVWGDAAAILVSIEALIVFLIPLALLLGLCALFFWMYIKVRPLLLRGQDLTTQVENKVDQATEALVTRVMKPSIACARLSALKQLLRRIHV